jgi:hypothetical protein
VEMENILRLELSEKNKNWTNFEVRKYFEVGIVRK